MVKKSYEDLSKQIVERVGGVDNVAGLTHCVTRLRFRLKDNGKADKESIEHLKGVLKVVVGNGQFQVVIGNAVEDVYDTVLHLYPIQTDKAAGASEEGGENTGNVLTRALNTMADIVNPIVVALAGAGMIKALLVILSRTLGVLPADSSTYLILAAASNSVFYFLPLFLAFSSAKRFNCNPFISVAIVGALVEPNFTGLIKHTGDVVSFLTIPVVLMSYSGTLIPAIVAVLVYSKLEKLLKRIIPKSIELFALSFVALIIMVPLTVTVIGPIGVTIANVIGNFVNAMSETNGLLIGAIVGAGWTFIVMFGVHWGIVPIMLNNIATYGYDIIRPMVAAATFASAGAAFGAFLRCKDKDNEAFALSTTIPALLGGVTEPIVYGISLRYKRPFIAQIIGGAIAGGFMGMMHTKAIVYVFPALTTLPAFIGDTFVYYVGGITMSFFITAILTYIIGFDEGITESSGANAAAAVETVVTKEKVEPANVAAEEIIVSCLNGTAVKLADVKDEVFASGAMGQGIGIIPEEGILYAPADGVVETVFHTGHAVGMKTAGGAELLMHIGINTVDMAGEGFTKIAVDGQQVKKGDKLIEFDIAKIKSAGYDTTTMLLVTNSDDYTAVTALTEGKVAQGDAVMEVRR